jgi:hypothetical protein
MGLNQKEWGKNGFRFHPVNLNEVAEDYKLQNYNRITFEANYNSN